YRDPLASFLKPDSFVRQPFGCALVVGQNRERRVDYFAEERLQDGSSLSSRQPPHTVLQLVPNLRADGAFSAMLPELREHTGIWHLPHRCRDGACVQQAPDHNFTGRPTSFWRNSPAQLGPRPASARS